MMPLAIRKLGQKSSHFEKIRHFFQEKIAPCYGDQKSALEKIQKNSDRECVLLFEGGKPVGLLVYKLRPVQEFGLVNCCEIKTLALFEPEKNAGKKYGSRLLAYVAKKAVKMQAEVLVVTVSTGKPDAVTFFSKMGFRVANVLKDRYVAGLDEFIFVYENPKKLLVMQNEHKTKLNFIENVSLAV